MCMLPIGIGVVLCYTLCKVYLIREVKVNGEVHRVNAYVFQMRRHLRHFPTSMEAFKVYGHQGQRKNHQI